jgi:hypothetical protein
LQEKRLTCLNFMGQKEREWIMESLIRYIKVARLFPLLNFVYPFSQCCGSGMFIPDPDFYSSRILIPDPKTATKERGKKNFCLIFL